MNTGFERRRDVKNTLPYVTEHVHNHVVQLYNLVGQEA